VQLAQKRKKNPGVRDPRAKIAGQAFVRPSRVITVRPPQDPHNPQQILTIVFAAKLEHRLQSSSMRSQSGPPLAPVVSNLSPL
jgi:hypothetical protein